MSLLLIHRGKITNDVDVSGGLGNDHCPHASYASGCARYSIRSARGRDPAEEKGHMSDFDTCSAPAKTLSLQ